MSRYLWDTIPFCEKQRAAVKCITWWLSSVFPPLLAAKPVRRRRVRNLSKGKEEEEGHYNA